MGHLHLRSGVGCNTFCFIARIAFKTIMFLRHNTTHERLNLTTSIFFCIMNFRIYIFFNFAALTHTSLAFLFGT